MNKVIISYVISLYLLFSFLFSNYTHSDKSYGNNYSYYDSLYHKSLFYIENEELEKSIMLLKEITLKQKSYNNQDNILIMNAHYNLGQIHLSRALNYEISITHFEYIFNNVYNSGYDSQGLSLDMKSLSELKEKSLFMLGYIYHNHIGNFSISQSYYSIFLSSFPNSELCFSVEYELKLINQEILNFKNK